jgi:hypothetical protein
MKLFDTLRVNRYHCGSIWGRRDRQLAQPYFCPEPSPLARAFSIKYRKFTKLKQVRLEKS